MCTLRRPRRRRPERGGWLRFGSNLLVGSMKEKLALLKHATRKTPGLYERVLAAGKVEDDCLVIADLDYLKLFNSATQDPHRFITKLTPPPNPLAEVPHEKWPAWALGVELLKKPEDAGVGDTVRRYADKLGGIQFKAMMAALGAPCKCAERQALWNKQYPYPKGTSE